MNLVKTKHVCLCVFTLSTCPYHSHISLLFEVIIVPDKMRGNVFFFFVVKGFLPLSHDTRPELLLFSKGRTKRVC